MLNPIEVYHGTARSFERFAMRSSGLHFGTFEQAAHAATMKLAKLPLDLYGKLVPDGSGWCGRIIKVRLNVSNVVRVPDARTSSAWASIIKRERVNGADCLVYMNEFEGREPSDSFVVFDTDTIEILEHDFTRNQKPESNDRPQMRA